MRLRVQTLPPLPDFKAWFIPNPQPSSIGEFKKTLYGSVGVLKEAHVGLDDIQLLLDDFELLNESPFSASLRDGDLVCVKALHLSDVRGSLKMEYREHRLSEQKKRKRADHSTKAHRPVKMRKVDQSSESGDLSTSLTSSTSSSQSSLSSTSTDTEETTSDSDSSSSSSSAPSARPSKRVARAQVLQSTRSPTQGPFVPPGEGKPTTHARNRRRKRLRAAQAEHRILSASQPEPTAPLPPLGVSQTNAYPLGKRIPSNSQSPTAPQKDQTKEVGLSVDVKRAPNGEADAMEEREVLMASLGNKNKKKGFKQFLMAPVPKKIVFTKDKEAVTSLTSTSSSTPVLRSTAEISTSQSNTPILVHGNPTQKLSPRLIPPSEIQERGELPPNMFVTSVDVEADLWNQSRKKKRNDRQRGIQVSYESEHSYDRANTQGAEEPTLSYGNEESVGSLCRTEDAKKMPGAPQFDWNKAEQQFGNAPKVVHIDDIKLATIVGWKSLDLNPQTFTPEILLIAAKVIELSDGVSSVKVQRLIRPTDPNSAFAGFFSLVESDPDAGEAELEIEEYHWADIMASDWRILQVS